MNIFKSKTFIISHIPLLIMGTRAQVKIVTSDNLCPIYLYQHYDGDCLFQTVLDAFSRGKDQIDDPEYMTRIIFSEMIRESIDDTVGYGISTDEHGDIEFLVEVNFDTQMITQYAYNLNLDKNLQMSFKDACQ